MSRIYTIPAILPVSFVPAGCLETERADVEVEIKYTVIPGCPETRECPASEPGLELESVDVLNWDGIYLEPRDLRDRVTDWLLDDGFDAAIENAADIDTADRDDAADYSFRERCEAWDGME